MRSAASSWLTIAASIPTSAICAASSTWRRARIPKSRTSAVPGTRSPGPMHSLFLRIFMLFWVAMALIVGGSIAITFTIAAREYEAPELQRHPSVAIQAAAVLTQGIGQLKQWLDANKNSIADRDLYIVGPDGADILGR